MLGFRRFLFVWLVFAGTGATGASELEVLRVDFDLVKQEGAPDPWYEIAIAVSVEQGEAKPGANPRFADDITVSIALATEVNRDRGRVYEFYASRVEYPALEVGQHLIRFYLPPEIVKRDRVRGEPFAYEIEILSPDGLGYSLVSRNLQAPAALQRFHSQLAANKSAGSAFVPQHKTPFAWLYPRDTPNPRFPSQ